MRMFEKKPCRGCWRVICRQENCQRWQAWFLESWKRFHRFAWRYMDDLGRREPDKFRYELPHMVRSPCVGCVCEPWCDKACSLRLKWWDERVGRLKVES